MLKLLHLNFKVVKLWLKIHKVCRLIAIIYDKKLPLLSFCRVPFVHSHGKEWERLSIEIMSTCTKTVRFVYYAPLHLPSGCRHNFIIMKLITWLLFLSLQGFYLYLYIGSMIFLLFMYATMFWGSSAPITSKFFCTILIWCSRFISYEAVKDFQQEKKNVFVHRLEWEMVE